MFHDVGYWLILYCPVMKNASERWHLPIEFPICILWYSIASVMGLMPCFFRGITFSYTWLAGIVLMGSHGAKTSSIFCDGGGRE